MKTYSKNQLLTDSSFRQPQHFKSLYIHIPFCKNICDYCALYSVVNNESSVRKRFLAKIEHDLKQNIQRLTPLETIFIGGGTPSQLTENELIILLSAIAGNCKFEKNCEFTIECNPSSITPEKLAIMKAHGVNRLSFGAQSTTRKNRNTLGRRTSEEQFLKAIADAENAQFKNINADLIYGIPGQTMEDWLVDLKKIKSLKLPHISAYSLILEEDTVLSSRYDTLDDELAVEMYNKAAEELVFDDIYRYEISNYSRPGFECRHNYHIWQGATYLGIGPAASSFDGEKRWTEIRDLNKWLEGVPPEIDDISPKARLAEIVAFGFRTVNGWLKSDLRDLYGRDALKEFSEIFENLCEEELLLESQDRFHPSAQGLLFADDIAEAFLLVQC